MQKNYFEGSCLLPDDLKLFLNKEISLFQENFGTKTIVVLPVERRIDLYKFEIKKCLVSFFGKGVVIS